jgi:hypothetical protein
LRTARFYPQQRYPKWEDSQRRRRSGRARRGIASLDGGVVMIAALSPRHPAPLLSPTAGAAKEDAHAGPLG